MLLWRLLSLQHRTVNESMLSLIMSESDSINHAVWSYRPFSKVGALHLICEHWCDLSWIIKHGWISQRCLARQMRWESGFHGGAYPIHLLFRNLANVGVPVVAALDDALRTVCGDEPGNMDEIWKMKCGRLSVCL